jgi:hypothetical protein
VVQGGCHFKITRQASALGLGGVVIVEVGMSRGGSRLSGLGRLVSVALGLAGGEEMT